MQVVLLKDVPKVGHKYQIKEVASGYGSNYLIPNGLAEFASRDAVKRADLKRDSHVAELKKIASEAQLVQDTLADKTITIFAKTNSKGGLFKAVGKKEIITAVALEYKIAVPEDMLEFTTNMKEIGEHEVILKSGEKTAKIILTIEEAKDQIA